MEKKMYLLNVLHGKWRLVIIESLFTSEKQFGELKSEIKGITAKVLTENLQFLVKNGILVKRTVPVFPIETRYSLSDTGLKMRPILDSIYAWSIDNYNPPLEEAPDSFYDIFK